MPGKEDPETQSVGRSLSTQRRELLSSYGQAVGSIAGVLGLVAAVGLVIVGLFSIVTEADPAAGQVNIFAGSVKLVQLQAWVVDGTPVMRYQVLTGLVIILALCLTVLVSATLA